MKVQLGGPPPTIDQVQGTLAQALPQYQYTRAAVGGVWVRETATSGAGLRIKKGSIVIGANFGSGGMRAMWGLMVIGLGILIPIIIYLTAWYPKQKKVVAAVAGVIHAVWGPGGSAYQPQQAPPQQAPPQQAPPQA